MDQRITPYLCCRGAARAIEFYAEALGAAVRGRIDQPDGRVGWASLDVEGSTFFVADEFPEIGFSRPPESPAGAFSALCRLVVSNVDALFGRAVRAGATTLEPIEDKPWGERSGKLRDPFGHVWVLAQHPAAAAAPPDEPLAALWKLADVITPLALRVAATLKLADHLKAGASSAADLAARTGADSDSLARLLRFLAARGVFAVTESGWFDAATPLAAILSDSHPSGTRRWLDLDGFGGTMDLAFVDLLATVRAGRPPKLVSTTSLDAPKAASFDALMETQSIAQAPAIVAGFAWPETGRVVDLGGGTGTLLAAILRARPRLRGTLVELAATAERAKPVLAKAGLGERCEVATGDLLESVPAGADVYVLKFVLHGLDDEPAVRALRLCRDAMPPSGRVLIVERSLCAGGDAAAFTAMDLRMMILGEGRERTLVEYSRLAERAGLAVHEARPLPVGPHLIELRRGDAAGSGTPTSSPDTRARDSRSASGT